MAIAAITVIAGRGENGRIVGDNAMRVWRVKDGIVGTPGAAGIGAALVIKVSAAGERQEKDGS